MDLNIFLLITIIIILSILLIINVISNANMRIKYKRLLNWLLIKNNKDIEGVIDTRNIGKNIVNIGNKKSAASEKENIRNMLYDVSISIARDSSNYIIYAIKAENKMRLSQNLIEMLKEISMIYGRKKITDFTPENLERAVERLKTELETTAAYKTGSFLYKLSSKISVENILNVSDFFTELSEINQIIVKASALMSLLSGNILMSVYKAGIIIGPFKRLPYAYVNYLIGQLAIYTFEEASNELFVDKSLTFKDKKTGILFKASEITLNKKNLLKNKRLLFLENKRIGESYQMIVNGVFDKFIISYNQENILL